MTAELGTCYLESYLGIITAGNGWLLFFVVSNAIVVILHILYNFVIVSNVFLLVLSNRTPVTRTATKCLLVSLRLL
jgi:hypothetical protein